MKKEVKHDEELAAVRSQAVCRCFGSIPTDCLCLQRAEQELLARQEAERSGAKLRAIEDAKVRMAAAGEQHTCTHTVSTLMKQTNAAGQKQLNEAMSRGVSRDRRLHHQGLLSKQNSSEFTRKSVVASSRSFLTDCL